MTGDVALTAGPSGHMSKALGDVMQIHSLARFALIDFLTWKGVRVSGIVLRRNRFALARVVARSV